MGGAWMETGILQILNMSLMGAYCILAVLLVRLLLKRQPKIFSYILWSVVLFRLLCPMSFESPFSAFHMRDSYVMTSQGMQTMRRIEGLGVWTQAREDEAEDRIREYDRIRANMQDAGVSTGTLADEDREEFSEGMNQEPAVPVQSSSEHSAGSRDSFMEKVENKITAFFYNQDYMQYFWFAAAGVWMAGVCVMLAYAVFSAVLLKKRLRKAERQEGYYVMEQLETPLVFGVLRPQIYLPDGLSEQELGYILEHERIHIRRLDYLIKPLAFLVLGIHWFNPLVWLAFSCMEKDMEMSCDEAVLKKLGREIRQDYSSSLLSLACSRRFLSGSPLAFGEGKVGNRIKNVLKYKKPSRLGMEAAGLLIILTGLFLGSNPQRAERDNYTYDRDTLPVYQKAEEDKAKELLASMGTMAYQEVMGGKADTKDFIIGSAAGEYSNLQRWSAFRRHAEAGQEDAVVWLLYTKEGDPVLHYISYRDGSYYALYDGTRDRYSGVYDEGVQKPCLKGCYNGTWITYYLVDEEEVSFWEIKEYQKSGEYQNAGSEKRELKIELLGSLPYSGLRKCTGAEQLKEIQQWELEDAVSRAVLVCEEPNYARGKFQTESHYNLKIEESEKEIAVYTHVLYRAYNSPTEVAGGGMHPARLIFHKAEDGSYQLKEYQTPYSAPELEQEFPEESYASFVPDYMEEECNDQAAVYFMNYE